MANELNKLLNGVEQVDDNALYENYAKQFGLISDDAKTFFGIMSQLAKEYNLEQLQATVRDSRKSKAEREKAEKELATTREQIAAQSAQAIKTINKNHYDALSNMEKVEYHNKNAEEIENKRKAAINQYNLEYNLAKAQGKSKNELAAITRKFNAEQKKAAAERDAELQKAADAQAAQSAQQRENTKAVWEEFKTGSKEGIKGMVQLSAGFLSMAGNFNIDSLAADFEKKAKAAQAKVDEVDDELKDLKELGSDDPEIQARIMELEEKKAELQREAIIKGNVASAAKMAAAVSSAISSSYKQAFGQAEQFLMTTSARLNSRLDGTNENFNKLTNTITSKLAISPFVKSTEVLQKMQKAVEEGIAYNVESRAFLGTISDKIAHTFDAFDSNLTRLIKLQQQDSTAARLGMEAALNKFFNKQFSDSSYLNELSDSVSAAIIEANSQLARNQSAEFEYIVQKWLGSLSSVGVSDETITSIAEGINYIATGNVQSLASNTQLQTLFAMSAAEANLEYSELLLNGLDASNTNKLLQAMVTYLKEIAEGSGNQVVKAAYGDVLNLKLSDMTALSNLSTADIANIASNKISYNNMLLNTQTQLSSLVFRTSLSEMLGNIYDNVMYSVASDMVNNPITWSMTKMIDFMDATGTDINIPFINAAGFGLDINTSVKGLMKMGMGIAQAFSLISNIVQGLGSAGGTQLWEWDIQESISRGSGNSFQLSTVLGGTSNSTSYATNMNQGDVTNSSLNQATDSAEETKEITNKNQPEAKLTLDDYVKMVVGDEAEKWLRTNDLHIEASFISGVNAIRTWDTHLKRISENNLSTDYLATHDPIAVQQLVSIFGKNRLSGSPGTINSDALYVYDNLVESKLNTVDTSIKSNYALITTLFGTTSLLNTEGELKVYDDTLLGSLDSLATAFSGSTIQIDNSLDKPLYVYVKNYDDMKSILEVQANDVKIEFDTTVITDALKKALGTDNSNGANVGVLATQIANAIAEKDLKVKNTFGGNLDVKITNTTQPWRA